MWRHFPTTELEPGPTVGLGCMQEELGRVYANETVNPPPIHSKNSLFPTSENCYSRTVVSQVLFPAMPDHR